MTLFVGHLTEKIKDTTLRNLFAPYGIIASIDRKGTYAFIEYESPADTGRAVRDLNKKEVLGTVLRVELSNRERGENGPAPGDLTETCYNCQQIGHIAKNCPLPVQPAQMLHLHSIHPQQRRNPLYSQYELEAGSSQLRTTTLASGPAKREGFLDQNPQKIRLVEHGSHRHRMNPYAHFMGSDGGSGSWSKSKGKGKHRTSTAHNTAPPRPYHLQTGYPQKQNVGSPLSDDGSFDALYASGMQSMLSSGVMKIAGEVLLPPTPHLNMPSPRYYATEFASSAHQKAPPHSYVLPGTGGSSTGLAQSDNHPYIPAPGAHRVENPYLPPGTLVYLPAVTVLPPNRSQSPTTQSYNTRTHGSIVSPPPHAHTPSYTYYGGVWPQSAGSPLHSYSLQPAQFSTGSPPLNATSTGHRQMYSVHRPPPPPPPPPPPLYLPQPLPPLLSTLQQQQHIQDKNMPQSKSSHEGCSQEDVFDSASPKTHGFKIKTPETDKRIKGKNNTDAAKGEETDATNSEFS